jgi:hypothetical protein
MMTLTVSEWLVILALIASAMAGLAMVVWSATRIIQERCGSERFDLHRRRRRLDEEDTFRRQELPNWADSSHPGRVEQRQTLEQELAETPRLGVTPDPEHDAFRTGGTMGEGSFRTAGAVASAAFVTGGTMKEYVPSTEDDQERVAVSNSTGDERSTGDESSSYALSEDSGSLGGNDSGSSEEGGSSAP